MPPVNGLHHITALGGDPQQNLDFYRGVMGLRLVKKTVNFDDPSTYHLFYAVDDGAPGTIISFFIDPNFAPGSPDIGQPVAVGFSIPSSAIDYWIDYLSENHIDFVEPFERFGKSVLGLQGPNGLHLELIGDSRFDHQGKSTGDSISTAHSIRGLRGVTLAEENYRATGQLLTESLGFELIDQQHDRVLFQMDAPLGNTIEVIDGAELNGEPGKGTVHHLAFRTKDEERQQQIRRQLQEIGYHVTELEDRYYFSSFFFHEPGGALLEVATDGPGFTIDENAPALGSDLCLPPELEGKRSLIEAELPKLDF